MRPKASVRVMVVEDFDSFRQFICSELEQMPEFADRLRSLRWTGSGTQGSGTKARPDFARHWPTNTEWHRGRTANSRTCAGIEDHFLEPGNLC